MVGKKQRFKTVVLIIFLAVVIVGGVFAVSYFKGGVTFPWQVVTSEQEAEPVAEEPAKEEPKLVVKEKADEDKAKKEEELKKAKEEADKKAKEEAEKKAEEDAKNAVVKTEKKLDYASALYVEDGKLIDTAGNEIVLTGVSSNSINEYPDYVSADAIKALRDNWGINVIRLAMYTSDYNGYCVGGKDNQEKLKGVIDEAVKAATENEMYVILDWHTLNDADPNEYKADAIQFFGEMVRKYESNENVIYEICNEPSGDTTWDDIRKYANEVIPVIKRIDGDALILVGTPDGCTDLDSVLENPLDFGNIMYTYHFNAGIDKSSQRNALTNALEDGLPVFISQYSYVESNGDVNKHEASRWNDTIDDYGLSSVIWNLSNTYDGCALVDNGCEKFYDFTNEDLSAQGQYFIDRINSLDRRNRSNDN
ncbi:glycoside hydrolase family 5 protein [Pseudobutyrivibrio xylanivorans]|uniref:cellulase n=1 Tax=Pseudobutyrivibrio xylanivorans TaxID=185007 RepID=A0A1G5S1Y4_PSEXY|nr:glycoside hydrolase family 5 protein [Pseudobutyrivibrio xylanivorans]SCZ80316.1 endoglucanase [Pseudobutyrivibrio xylanivorans]